MDTNHILYIPMLKAKQGELFALRDANSEVLDKLIPLFDITSVPYDYENEKFTKTASEHINDTLKNIKKYYKNRPFYLDFSHTLYDEVSINRNPFECIESENLNELQLIPVTSLYKLPEHHFAVNKLAQSAQRGCAIRMSYDLADDEQPEPTEKDFEIIIERLNLDLDNIDLILDLGSVYKQKPDTIYWATRLLLAEIPYIDKWRNIIVSASSFPESLAAIKKDSMEKIERSEWLAWLLLHKNKEKLKRLPTYSDYSIAHPILPDIDPRMMNVSAGIRYTSHNDWLILRGSALKQKNGYTYFQFRDLCRELVTTKDYYGKEYTKGDAFIYECATNEQSTTGNLSTWRKVSNDHHFKVVVEQLASLNAK